MICGKIYKYGRYCFGRPVTSLSALSAAIYTRGQFGELTLWGRRSGWIRVSKQKLQNVSMSTPPLYSSISGSKDGHAAHFCTCGKNQVGQLRVDETGAICRRRIVWNIEKKKRFRTLALACALGPPISTKTAVLVPLQSSSDSSRQVS